jgi:predicted dehydrogenase
MSTDSESATRIATFAKETGNKLTIAHYRRQQPYFQKIRSLLEEKVIGKVRMVNLQFYQPALTDLVAKTEENWRLDPSISGGGLFHDLAPHQLDLMIYFFGKPLRARGLSFNAGKNYEADDIAGGQIEFDGPLLFNGSWCFSLDDAKDECEIIGTEGKITFGIFIQKPIQLIRDNEPEYFSFEPLQHVQQPMIEKVVQYLQGKAANPCSAEEGVEVMRLIDTFTNRPAY